MAAIRRRFPWPDVIGDLVAVPVNFDYGGRRLISELIAERGLRVVLEIGSAFGGSARQWLEADPGVIVICVDPWPDFTGPDRGVAGHPRARPHTAQLLEPDGFYRTFLATMQDVRDRVVAVRAGGIQCLPELHALGLRPDLVYLDADKRGDEIPMCDALFPDSLISGDDWLWRDGYGFPIQAPARDSARRRGRWLKTCGTTWLIDDRPWTARQRWLQAAAFPRGVAQVASSFVRQIQGRTSHGSPRGPRPPVVSPR